MTARQRVLWFWLPVLLLLWGAVLWRWIDPPPRRFVPLSPSHVVEPERIKRVG